MIRSANLAAKFLLELAALASFAYWGWTRSGSAGVVLTIVAPLAVAILWGTLAAPRAKRRLPATSRIPFELAVFALAAIALFAAGSHAVTVVLAACVAVNAALLTVFGQWEQ
jgi:Protein of unknown function (DUF2568)